MTGAAGPVEIDARGLRCPWPALRLARAMRDAERAVILADDPAAPAEFRALAENRGWSIRTFDGDPIRFAVSRA